MSRRRAGLVLGVVGACLAAACDGFGDGRLQRLEQEVQALRATQTTAPADVAAAMAPLRGAIDVLVQRGDTERARQAALASEIDQLATLVQGFVDAGRRAEVEALRARIVELERQAQEQAKAQSDDRAVLLRALEATASRLEVFLQQASAQPRKGAAAPVAAPGFDLWRSLRDPRALWPLGVGLASALLLFVWSRRRRRPRVLALDPPEAFVDAPAPVEFDGASPSGAAFVGVGSGGVDFADVGGDRRPFGLGQAGPRPRGPIPMRVEVRAGDVELASRHLTTWLAQDPRVLARPVPACEARGGAVDVRFYVAEGMSPAERASLAAEVRVRGCAESDADRRSA